MASVDCGRLRIGFDWSANPVTRFPMLNEALRHQAAHYVAGTLPADARESFEVLLEAREELRRHVRSLQEVVATMTLAGQPAASPPAELKNRLLETLQQRPRPASPECLVVTDAEGRVEWVNAAFIAMCGHDLNEIKGRKPGQVLQGPETDAAAVARIRAALAAREPCHETLVNYHKDGSPYRVDVRINPILDEDGAPLQFVARERKLSDPA